MVTKEDTKESKSTKPMRSDEQLLKLTVAEMHTCTKEEAARLRQLLLNVDKKIREKDPDAKGIMGGRSYEQQPMDEMVDALGSLISGNPDDVPKSYNKLHKDEAIRLRDALQTVIKLGSKMVVKGHVFDLRFDQRGHGWAKLTENWRKETVDGKEQNKMQDEFESYKGNPTVKLG